MSFHRRYLDIETIKSYANKHTFEDFQMYMCSADSYHFEDDAAFQFYIEFTEEENYNKRKESYNKLLKIN